MRFWLMICLCCLALAAPAGAAETQRKPAGRPVIGLVLSGGGALGATHVGVIKVLEELKVPVDIVVGTSMGSIVGGLYAMGLNAGEMDGLVRSIDWAAAFEDRPPRNDRSFRRKQDDYGFMLDLKVGIKDGAIQFPPGLIQGQRLTLLLRALTLRSRSISDFDALPIRYRAVAADLETGREVVLGRGNIATAMRASMSVPGVFPPVDVDGKLLVDGGVANNLPVDVARAMGAEVVIVVDIPTILKKRDKLRSTMDIAGQMLSVLIQQNSLAQLRSLGPDDVLIQPDLGDMSAADFGRIADAIGPGEAAARGQAGKLAALAGRAALAERAARGGRPALVGDNRTAAGRPAGGATLAHGGASPLARSGASPREALLESGLLDSGSSGGSALPAGAVQETPVIAFIELVNQTRLADARIRNMIRQKVGEPLDIGQLEQDFARLYGLGDFEQVDYALVERNGRIGMVVTATEKSWAKDYFRVGLSLEHDFSGRSTFTLGGAITFTGLDANGAEWRSELSIGGEQRLYTEYLQPFQPTPGWFVMPQLEYYQRNYHAYANGSAAAEYRMTTAEARLMAGAELSGDAMVAVGLRFGRGDLDRLVGDMSPRTLAFDIGGAQALFLSDTLDDVNFPGDGHIIRSMLELSSKGMGASEDYARLDVNVTQAFTIGDTKLILGGRGGTALSGDLPVYDRFSAGGLFSVSGYSRNEISGSNLLLAHMVLMQPLTETTPLAFNLPLYLGGSLEAAAVDDGSGEGLDRQRYGGSVFLGAATPLGPVYLGLGLGDNGRRAAYLYMGKLF